MARIVFFGTDEFSLPALKALIENDWDVATVVTKPDSKSGRGRKLTKPKVAELADQYGIDVLQPDKMDNELIARLKNLDAEIGILVSFGRILPNEILNIFSKGVINIHASLLPKYRGPSPIEAAILNGDKETGVSLMKLDIGMDTGPVYAIKTVKLSNDIDRPALYQILSQLGAQLLSEVLQPILDGKIEPSPQDESAATYTKLITKGDGLLDTNGWDKPAEVIERTIRAYRGWPGVRTADDLQIIKAVVDTGYSGPDLTPGEIQIDRSSNSLQIGTGDRPILATLVKPSGKKEMTAADYLRGLKD